MSDLIDRHVLMEQLQKATTNAIKPDFARGLLEAQRLCMNAPTVESPKEIRWTDKVTLDADGNIRDFDGTILYSLRNEYGKEAQNDTSN